MSSKSMRVTVMAVCLAALALGVLAGCGSSGGSSSGGSSSGGESSGESGVSAADLKYAEGQIAAHSGIPKFESEGKPIDISSLKGKTIYSIPITTSIPFYKTGEQAMKEIAEKAGVKYVTFPSQGNVSDFQQGFADAINAGASAIILNGPLPETVTPQIAAAHKAGIKVIVAHEEDPSEPAPAGVDAVAAGNFNEAARLMTDEAIARGKGEPVHALVISSDDTQPSKGMVAAIQEELEKHCGSECSATVTNVPVADWATKIQPAVQSALVREGEINAVLPIYDSMSTYVDPAITQAGAGREINIYSFNGTPEINEKIQEGNTALVANVGESPVWIGYVTMDQTFRAMLGDSPLKNPAAPLRIWTEENIEEAGEPPVAGEGFGEEYEAGYAKLWGIQ